jgi:hypothetical protein
MQGLAIVALLPHSTIHPHHRHQGDSLRSTCNVQLQWRWTERTVSSSQTIDRHCLVVLESWSGVVNEFWGSGKRAGQFNRLAGIAVSEDGQLVFVADYNTTACACFS